MKLTKSALSGMPDVLEDIKPIQKKIKKCMEYLSKYFDIGELKTEHIKASIIRGKVKLEKLEEDDPQRKSFMLLSQDISVVLTFHYISHPSRPKEKNAEIIMSNIIRMDGYKWNYFRSGVENTNLGAIVSGYIEDKYDIWLAFEKCFIKITHSFDTNFNVEKILKEIHKFKGVLIEIRREVPLLIKDIKNNPKKYNKVDKKW